MSTTQSTGRLARLLAFLVEHPDVSFENVVVSEHRIGFTVYHDAEAAEALRAAIQPSEPAWTVVPRMTGYVVDQWAYNTSETPLGLVTVWLQLDHHARTVAA